MRNQKGITLSSLIVYVIAMVVVVATIATVTKYFYGNLNYLTDKTDGSKEYTTFTSYFTKEINTEGNKVISCSDDKTVIIFSSGNQYTFTDEQIYMNKINICSNVSSCEFTYSEDNPTKVTVQLVIDGKDYNNTYTLKQE